LLEKSLKNIAVQRALFLGSAALGAAGMLSGGWMVARGDLSYATGLIGSAFPLAIGFIGLHKLWKPGPSPSLKNKEV
jgi:hypothetical protein